MRKYNLTYAELIDRLSILILKEIFIPENKEEYRKEQKLILHDLGEQANLIYGTLVIMLTNRYIWENESKVRNGESQDLHLLKLTHSINGVRNTAKNLISSYKGERLDFKVDCLADNPDWELFKVL